MADFSLIQENYLQETDDDVFEQGEDGSSDDNGSSGDGDGSFSDKSPNNSLPPLKAVQAAAYLYGSKTIITTILQQFSQASPDVLLEDLPKIMKVLEEVMDNSQSSNKSSILERIPALMYTAVEYSEIIPGCYDILIEYLLPLLVRYINIDESQLRKVSHNTLIILIEEGLISKAKAEIQICPSLLAFTNDEEVHYFYEFISLMIRMGKVLGKDVTERVFLKRFSELCTIDKFFIRKACAAKMGEFCAIVTEQTNEKILFPIFLNLCEDSVWTIRKSCADVVVTISCICSPLIRTELLSPAFEKLLNDEDNRVNSSAFQALGPFIATFADPQIIRLDYNSSGDLILKNFTGNQYKVNSSYGMTVDDFFSLSVGFGFEVLVENTILGNNVIDEDEKCDNLTSDINTITNQTVNMTLEDNLQNVELSKEETNLDKVEDNKSSDEGKYEENLDLYNSYYYWYVPPDTMPLDPNIVNSNNNEIVSVNHEKLNNDSPEKNECNETIIINSPIMHQFKRKPEEIIIVKPQSVVPQFLLEKFVSMINSDSDLSYFCAYSFPGVVLTLGKDNWEIIKDLLPKLANHKYYKVRHTVASYLHEIALILGPEISSEDLAPIFNDFIKDLDIVKAGIVKHLVDFLKLINEEKRNLYLPKLTLFLQNHEEQNWRIRYDLVEQLILAVEISPIQTLYEVYVVGFGLLCVDKISAVRQISTKLITRVLKQYIMKPGKVKKMLGRLTETFAHSKKWKFRQIFVMICHEILSTEAVAPKIFVGELMPHLLDLSWDPVANVRLAVSKTISQQMVIMPYFIKPENQHYDNLQSVLRRLQTDKDRDVRHLAQVPTPADTTTSAE